MFYESRNPQVEYIPPARQSPGHDVYDPYTQVSTGERADVYPEDQYVIEGVFSVTDNTVELPQIAPRTEVLPVRGQYPGFTANTHHPIINPGAAAPDFGYLDNTPKPVVRFADAYVGDAPKVPLLGTDDGIVFGADGLPRSVYASLSQEVSVPPVPPSAAPQQNSRPGPRHGYVPRHLRP